MLYEPVPSGADLPPPQSVDLSALLLYIHEFFDALGPEELRKRGAREDKPVGHAGIPTPDTSITMAVIDALHSFRPSPSLRSVRCAWSRPSSTRSARPRAATCTSSRGTFRAPTSIQRIGDKKGGDAGRCVVCPPGLLLLFYTSEVCYARVFV